MPGRSRAPRRPRRSPQTPTHLEWIGGRLSPPFFIRDREEPYRADLIIWMEVPTGLVVGQEAIDADGSPGAVSRVLRNAFERPAAGPPRRPNAIRVGDASLAAEVRAAVGTAIPVVVAPTPELDELLELMLESLPGEPSDESYLDGGRIQEATVRKLFAATEILVHIAPWTVASDDQVLRLDIPALGVDGACVSIIGQLGQSLGFLIFPSLAGYEAFLRVAEKPRPPGRRVDLGTGWLALSLEHGRELPPSMRGEAELHGWPVANADAYPRVERRDPDGASRPLVERDLQIATACAISLSTFVIKHRTSFEADEFQPICESFFDEHDLEVRLTLPYEAFSLFDVDDVPDQVRAPTTLPGGTKVGRNDPCPCGSGRKYKKCCHSADVSERPERKTSDPQGATNPYCAVLGIPVPSIEVAWKSPDANYYAMLIVALLERGEPITLEDAARRFDQAGVAPEADALQSLKRCRPGRPPIYRDGDRYALDPHDDEADLWAFRLGLRPPRVQPLRVVRPDPGPLPSPDEPLTEAHLDEAWRQGVPNSWSAQRVAVCVLDAHTAAMRPDRVLDFVAARAEWSPLSSRSADYWRRGAAIRVRDDGMWELDPGHDAVRSARHAVRARVDMLRRHEGFRPDPASIKAASKRAEIERQANAARLARMRRVLVHPFPARNPQAVVLIDIGAHEITTLMGDEVAGVKTKLADYDSIAAVDVRAFLRRLGFEPGERHLAELGPPQKTKKLNRRGRTLKITTTLLTQGSCGISRPFADESVLRRYVQEGKHAKLRRRLEADAKSLYALYQYGRLHGAVRLRWGFLDEAIPAPWVHRDEPTLYNLMQRANDLGAPLEVVVGSAPGWADPWSRARLAYVEKDDQRWRSWLVDEQGYVIERDQVQLARLAVPE